MSKKIGRPTVLRPHRFTISLSDDAMEIVDRYCGLMGISRAKLIDSFILEGKDQHLAYLEELEELKRKFTE